jgi:hypothetical protein
MPSNRLPRIQITALRACGHHQQGMRHSAHRKTMQTLQGLGYLEERAPHLGRDLRTVLQKQENGVAPPWGALQSTLAALAKARDPD